jgi:hypothetical protein
MQNELQRRNKETTIIGIVREIEDKRKFCRAGIACGNQIYVVKLNEAGKDLLYEVGNKVEATGILSETGTGDRRIKVTDYRVFEMDEDDLDDYGVDPDFYFNDGS